MPGQINILIAFGAGITSVLSPCVLPVVPLVIAGPDSTKRARPLLVVSGLSVMFVLMGIASTLFASVIGPLMPVVEKAAAVVIIVFGLLMFANVNLFKHLSFLSNLGAKGRSGRGGFLLGATLGLIWIPCIGPVLSGVLAMVASEGTLTKGIFYLLIYSAGFSIPLLFAGYASQLFRNHTGIIKRHPAIYRIASGILLTSLGVFILTKGMIAFGSW